MVTSNQSGLQEDNLLRQFYPSVLQQDYYKLKHVEVVLITRYKVLRLGVICSPWVNNSIRVSIECPIMDTWSNITEFALF